MAAFRERMPRMSGPTARVLELLSLLQTHRFWPGPELAAQLEVSQRTLRRDIERLRDLGYPVDAVPGPLGGYRLAAGTHLPPLLLDDDEAVAIAVGLGAAAGAAVDGIEDTSLRALAKLEQLLPDRLRRRVGSIHDTVAVLRSPGTRSNIAPDALAVLAQACRDHEEVRFEYRSRAGETTSRRVEPYQLVSVGRRWYLVAWDVRRNDWRTFRGDRLEHPALLGARFAPRTLPARDAASFVEASLRRQPMPFTASVVVRGDAGEIDGVARWLDAESVPIGPDRRRLVLRTDSDSWLAAMLVMLAADFDVDVEAMPTPLADRVASAAERVTTVVSRRGTGVSSPMVERHDEHDGGDR